MPKLPRWTAETKFLCERCRPVSWNFRRTIQAARIDAAKKAVEPGSGTAIPETLNAPAGSTDSTVHDPSPALIALSEEFGVIYPDCQITPFPGVGGVSINQYCSPASKSGSSTESTTMRGLSVPEGPRTSRRLKVSRTVPGWFDASVAKLISTSFAVPSPSDKANDALSNMKFGPPEGIVKE
jgi:hypothetical protein